MISESINNIYQPIFFRLNKPKDKEKYQLLLQSGSPINVYDEIKGQLSELIKSLNPTIKINQEEYPGLIEKHLNGISISEYGIWVFYPWNKNLVHLLDEEEFIEVRTNRNRYKITNEEQNLLRTKKIGVIGLSVGQSVSLTLAIERGFGELRIADFDELELTNLNRLRAGVHNLGLKKTVIVAREIAEIDPFLKITCYHEGITEDNIADFLLTNGKLDVLIDECDGVDIKLKCRIEAKKHQIPVLMEASDRGTVDVERFDLEPTRPLLHGFVEHLDVSKFHTLTTNEQKLPYLLAFAGIETLSTRMKASAVEVGQTISTWPQLASAVTMGGGIAADVCRRILLDQFHQSGRYFIDLEELIGDPKEAPLTFDYKTETLTNEKMKAFAAQLTQEDNEELVTDAATINILMQAAVVAPSPGNNQPWKWYFDGKQLLLLHDLERSVSYGDFENMASYMSFGTAIENVQLKATELKLKVKLQLFPLKENGTTIPIAVFSFTKSSEIVKDELVDYINVRYTNRRKGNGTQIAADIIEEIKLSASSINEVSIKFLTDLKQIQQVANITGKAEKLRMFIPEGHSDLFTKEIRWTPESAEITRDGLDVRTLDLSSKDAIGFRVLKDANAIKLVSKWNKGSALENMTKDLVATAAVTGLIVMPSFTPENCLLAGIAAQRIWLTSSKYNIAMQPVLASVLHFARLIQGNGRDMPTNIQKQFKELHKEFVELFKLNSSEVPLFLFRLFTAEEPSIKSLRLDVRTIYSSSESL